VNSVPSHPACLYPKFVGVGEMVEGTSELSGDIEGTSELSGDIEGPSELSGDIEGK